MPQNLTRYLSACKGTVYKIKGGYALNTEREKDLIT